METLTDLIDDTTLTEDEVIALAIHRDIVATLQDLDTTGDTTDAL